MCNPTAESHTSICGTVAYDNPAGLSQAYHTTAGTGTDCGDSMAGTWAASGNQTLPPGGGTIIVVELVDTITVDSAN